MKYCIRCNDVASEYHEIWGGANRKFCITIGLQVPLCRSCHSEAEQFKKESPKWFCILLGLDYEKVNKAMNRRLFDVESLEYLHTLSGRLKDRLNNDEA